MSDGPPMGGAAMGEEAPAKGSSHSASSRLGMSTMSNPSAMPALALVAPAFRVRCRLKKRELVSICVAKA